MARAVGRALIAVVLVLAAGLAWVLSRGAVEPLRVGTNVWVGYEPLHVAHARGALPDSLELVEYVSTTQVLSAFVDGEIDAAGVTLDEALRLASATHDVALLVVTDVSNGGDALVAHPARATLGDLKGARVGVERSALGAYMLTRALERAGLSEADLIVVPLPVNEHRAAYGAGAVDAVVTFEPELSRVRALGGKVLFTSREIPGEIVDVIVVRRSLALRHPELAAALRHEWFTASRWALAHPADFARLAAPRLQVAPEEVPRQLEGVTLPSEQESEHGVRGGLQPVATRLAAAMRRAQLAPVSDEEVRSLFSPLGP